MDINRLKKLAGTLNESVKIQEEFDYSKDDVAEISDQLFHDFRDNFGGMMSKEVATLIVTDFANRIMNDDEFPED